MFTSVNSLPKSSDRTNPLNVLIWSSLCASEVFGYIRDAFSNHLGLFSYSYIGDVHLVLIGKKIFAVNSILKYISRLKGKFPFKQVSALKL